MNTYSLIGKTITLGSLRKSMTQRTNYFKWLNDSVLCVRFVICSLNFTLSHWTGGSIKAPTRTMEHRTGFTLVATGTETTSICLIFIKVRRSHVVWLIYISLKLKFLKVSLVSTPL